MSDEIRLDPAQLSRVEAFGDRQQICAHDDDGLADRLAHSCSHDDDLSCAGCK